MNNQGNIVAQKDEKFPENKCKDMEICDLNGREVKIAVLETKQTTTKTTSTSYTKIQKGSFMT